MTSISHDFSKDGAFIKINGSQIDKTYKVKFINLENDELIYETIISENCWASSSIRATNIKVYDNDNNLIYNKNKNEDIIVHIHVLCYNEEKIIPFILDYWNEIATKVFVYDNNSTDNSIELLKNEKRFEIEIIPFGNDVLNDWFNRDFKNQIWKKSKNKCDFVIVSDFDEVIYSPNIMDELKYMKINNQTICNPISYDIISFLFPEHDKNLLPHNILNGYDNSLYRKKILFNPNEIEEINFQVGCHFNRPIGNINYYDNSNIYLFHFKMLSPDYILYRYKKYVDRLSENNKNLGLGMDDLMKAVCYNYDFSIIYNVINEMFKSKMEKSFKILDKINNNLSISKLKESNKFIDFNLSYNNQLLSISTEFTIEVKINIICVNTNEIIHSTIANFNNNIKKIVYQLTNLYDVNGDIINCILIEIKDLENNIIDNKYLFL